MKKKIESQELFDEGKLYDKRKSVWSKVFFALFIIYIILFIIFMASYMSFKARFTCVPVTGRSMQPTINASVVKNDPNNPDEKGDWVYIEKRELKYGDIIVFDAKPYNNEEICLIKRLIAFEGDAVTIVKTQNPDYDRPIYTIHRVKAELLLDGSIDDGDVEQLKEDYISNPYDWTYNSYYSGLDPVYEESFKNTFLLSTSPYEKITDSNGITYAIIPSGEFFYMADNRSEGSDSRRRGTDYVSSIRGAMEIHVKDAENSSSALFVQIREVCNYYFNIIGDFCQNLWYGLEKAFDI